MGVVVCVSLLGHVPHFAVDLWHLCSWTALTDLWCADLCRWVCVQSGEFLKVTMDIVGQPKTFLFFAA